MTSIITADVIDSRKAPNSSWIDPLKNLLSGFGNSPQTWEIYRGDELQLEITPPEEVFISALKIKAVMKISRMDVRMSIGIGNKSYTASRLSESNGTAFMRSGESFELLRKQKLTLILNTGNADIDNELNLMIQLALTFLDSWLPQSAEFFLTAIENPQLSQEELGNKLGITQAAVSRKKKRAQFDLLMDLDRHFRSRIKTLKP